MNKPCIFFVCAVLSLGAACSKTTPEAGKSLLEAAAEGDGTGTVCIRLEGILATKVANPSEETEKQGHRWAFWLFDQDGDSVVYGSGQAGEEIRRTVLTGSYTAVALVNYPDGLDPISVKKIGDIRLRVAGLADNTPSSLLMYGETPLTLEKDLTVEAAIEVKRLVAKVGVKKVTVAFENPYLAAKTTVLQAIYLTNVYRSARLGKDYTVEELSPSRSAWYNAMGWHLSGENDPACDRLLGEEGLNAVLTAASPHTDAHYFYTFPNPVPESQDTHQDSWSVRATRMVLQVAVGNKVFYYQIAVPGMERNKVYLAEEVVLRNLGSQDPELEIPGSIDVVFSAFGKDWDNDYSITENS